MGSRQDRRYGRFTSACAETIIIVDARGDVPAVHLRVCGDNVIKFNRIRVTVGSPPRVRRQSVKVRLQAVDGRFTSACAETIPSSLA